MIVISMQEVLGSTLCQHLLQLQGIDRGGAPLAVSKNANTSHPCVFRDMMRLAHAAKASFE
jgi:hypothetical protein